MPHVYIHMHLHRSGVHPLDHYPLSFECHSKDNQNAYKHVLSKVGAYISDVFIVIFLKGV